MASSASAVPPETCLEHARQALLEGAFDGRHPEGARANALESIAWSLLGLLEQRVAGKDAPESTLASTLEDAGFVRLDRKQR